MLGIRSVMRSLGLVGPGMHRDAGSVLGGMEYAFRLGGVDYWRFVDLGNMPVHRALRAAEELRNMSLGLSREHWEGFVSMCDEFASGRVSMKKFVEELVKVRDRGMWATETMSLFRLCGIVYIDNNERAMYVDERYLERKVRRWMSLRGAGFFLSGPMTSLSGYGGLSGWSIQVYLRVAAERAARDLEGLMHESVIGREPLLMERLRCQAETLRRFAEFTEWD